MVCILSEAKLLFEKMPFFSSVCKHLQIITSLILKKRRFLYDKMKKESKSILKLRQILVGLKRILTPEVSFKVL